MGGVIFRQTTKEAVRRFAEAGIDTEKYMGEHGQKGFFLDIETGRIDTDEFCRRMAEESHRESVTYEEAEAVGIHGLHVQQNEDWTPLLVV